MEESILQDETKKPSNPRNRLVYSMNLNQQKTELAVATSFGFLTYSMESREIIYDFENDQFPMRVLDSHSN